MIHSNGTNVTISGFEIGSAPFFDGEIGKFVFDHKASKTQRPIRHWLPIVDLSGSVAWALPQLIEDTIAFVSQTGPEDFITVVRFSGHGEAKVIVGPTKDKKEVARALQHMRTLSTTVFSDALDITATAANLSAVSGLQHRAVLFTDGHPVPTRWTTNEEIRRSLASALKLADKDVVLSTFGVGNYYNGKFIADLVDSNGGNGICRHIDDFGSFREVISQIGAVNESLVPALISLEVVPTSGTAGVVLRTSPQVSKAGDKGKVFIRAVAGDKTTLYVALPKGTKKFALRGTVNGEPCDLSPTFKILSEESIQEAALAGASYAFASGDLPRAAELLSFTGDAALSNSVANANSDRELLSFGDQLRQILVNENIRPRYAQSNKYIGAGEARCMMNLMRALVEDDCKVYMPEGEYVKTTVTSVDPNLRYKPRAQMAAYAIQSNQDRYNFSFKFKVQFQRRDPATKVWSDSEEDRNYVIVKDGSRHVKRLDAYLTERVFNLCQSWGVLPANLKFNDRTLYNLDLSVNDSLPVIISSWASPVKFGLVDIMKEEMLLAAEQTPLNRRIDELRVKVPGRPRPEKQPATDWYPAVCVQYSLKGYKVTQKFDFSSSTDLPALEARIKEVRRRLMKIRLIKRTVQFAMDKAGNKLFAGKEVTDVMYQGKPSPLGKTQQIVDLDAWGYPGLQLRRVAWTAQIGISPGGADAEDLEDAA